MLIVFINQTGAHHYKGLPHYNYFDNYPQVPILEFIQETGNYEAYVTIYNFQGLSLDMVEAPDDVRFYIYIFDIAEGKSYLGPADFDIYSHDKLVHKFIQIKQEEESIYTLRSTIKEQDDLILKISFTKESGEKVSIDMPIEITDSFWDKYWLYFAVGLFFIIVVTVKKTSERGNHKEKEYSVSPSI